MLAVGLTQLLSHQTSLLFTLGVFRHLVRARVCSKRRKNKSVNVQGHSRLDWSSSRLLPGLGIWSPLRLLFRLFKILRGHIELCLRLVCLWGWPKWSWILFKKILGWVQAKVGHLLLNLVLLELWRRHSLVHSRRHALVHWRRHLPSKSKILGSNRVGSWVVSSIPQVVDLKFELLGHIEVLAVDCYPLLLLKLNEFLAYGVKSVDGLFDVLGQVKVFLSNRLIFFLLQFFNLKRSLRIQSSL